MPNFQYHVSSIADDGSLTPISSAAIVAASDNAAVDAVRALHEKALPDIGGNYEIVVTALDPGVTEMICNDAGLASLRPPGEISRWTTTEEPIEFLRASVYAARTEQAAEQAAEKLEAEKVAAIRVQVVAELVAAASPEMGKAIAAVADQVSQATSAGVDVRPVPLPPQTEPAQFVQSDTKVQS